MKLYKSLLATLLVALISVGFTGCDGDLEYPPTIMPEQVGDGSSMYPYSVGSALTAIYSGNYTTKKVFVEGIVSKIETTADDFNPSYGNITYYISDDGTETNQLEVYRGLGLNGDKFASADGLKVGDKVVIYCQLTYYNNSVAETNQGAIIVSLNGSPYDKEEPTEPKGDGSGEAPYNVTAALNLIFSDGFEGADVYVEGIVSKIDNIDTSYGNATYYISDSGSTLDQLEIYRGYSLDGKKFTSTDEIKVGDKVIVYGKVVLFNSTPEFTTGSKIVSLNGSSFTPETPPTPPADPTGEGTTDSPYNVAKALKIINDNAFTEGQKVYVSGIIASIKEIDTGSFGNATYYISDDGANSNTLYIYRGYALGNEHFTSADQIKVGDKVVIYGELMNYKGNSPQMAQGNYIYSLNGSNGGNSGTPDTPSTGDTVYSGLVSNLDGWEIVDVTLPEGGTYVWSWKEYNGSGYLNGSGYINGAKEAEAYAYTTIDLTGCASATVAFDHAAKFQTTLKQLCGMVVRVKGTNEWTKLDIPTWPEAGTWTFVNSGDINLAAYAGKTIEIGFLYKSSSAGADTWEIKNFVVKSAK